MRAHVVDLEDWYNKLIRKKMIKSLCLIDVKKVEFKDGDVKHKYIFIDENGRAMSGFTDERKYEELIHEGEDYDRARAREWNVNRDEYNGKLTMRVDVTAGVLAKNEVEV